MAGRILEREYELAELAAAAREAAARKGSLVLIHGEAGIGKSSLVHAVRSRLPAEGRMLVGHCDDLATPRVLGPFRDLIGSVGSELAAALEDGDDRDRILAALRSELDWSGRPTVLAIEDAHWADDASLDLLRFLVRRVNELPVVLVLTYRDEELYRGHPLHQVLGITSGGVRRLMLRRLSASAVRQLSATAASEVDADELFAVTSGNPFFVTEVLGNRQNPRRVPPTVVAAVLARLGSLGNDVREAVQQLSVIPNAIDRQLVDSLVGGGLPALAEAEERGLLNVTPTRVTFRHELTRRAVVDAIPAARRTALNRTVLDQLAKDQAADVAKLMHHAAEAGDAAMIVAHGPGAAKTASASGAHREAAAYYDLVLEHADAFDSASRSALYELCAIEHQTIGDPANAVRAQRQAVRLSRDLGDDAVLGARLCAITRMHWWAGDRPAAEATAREAFMVIERTPNLALLARAYNGIVANDVLAYRATEAMRLAEDAVALARKAGDDAILAYGLANLGLARWRCGQAGGREVLDESLWVALAASETDHVCRAYATIGWELLGRFQLTEAAVYIDAGVELADRSEQFGFLDYLNVQRARLQLARGAWDEAVRIADLSLTADRPGIRCAALTVVGRVRARRREPHALEDLAEAGELGLRLDEPQWLGPAAAAAAEGAYLRGDAAAAVDVAAPPFRLLVQRDATPLSSELGFWLKKAGHTVTVPAGDEPFALLANGRWREAAEVFDAEGARYEHALALCESAEPRDVMAALDTLDALGAAALADLTRRRLRALGVAGVPRGPAASTRQNPAGLTQRQVEVLELLEQGLSNAEIAERLVVSVRTAGNHVAAVLDKLGARTRDRAVQVWRDLRQS